MAMVEKGMGKQKAASKIWMVDSKGFVNDDGRHLRLKLCNQKLFSRIYIIYTIFSSTDIL